MSQTSYSSFTLDGVKKGFHLTIDQSRDLFADIPEVAVQDAFKAMLQMHMKLAFAINTEKARSELIIAPLLVEVWKMCEGQISLFSGVDFHVEPDMGLKGTCDYILSRSSEQFYVTAPVVLLVEAKNENIRAGLAQCIAEMVAARLFNEREENGLNVIYGAVTAGNIWKFLTLEGDVVYVDVAEYYIAQIGKILAILLHMVGGNSTFP